MSVVLIPAGKQKIENLDPADATTSTENVSLKSTQSGEPETVMTYEKRIIPIDDPIPKDAVLLQEYVPGSDMHRLVFMAADALESIQWYQEQLSDRCSSLVGVCSVNQRARVAREKDIAAVHKTQDFERKTEEIERKYVAGQRKRKADIAALQEEIEDYEEYETITHAFGKYKKYREGIRENTPD